MARKKMLTPSVSLYPKILADLAEQARDHTRIVESINDPDLAEAFDPIQEFKSSLRADPVLWWVTRPMAMLAHDYAGDLPKDWAFHEARPAASGIIIWQNGTGQIADDVMNLPGLKQTRAFHIHGIWWAITNGETFFSVLIDVRKNRYQSRTGYYLLWAADLCDEAEMRERYPRLWAMFGASLILAQTETVAVRKDFRYSFDQHQRYIGKRPKIHENQVKQIVLREQIRTISDASQDAENNGGAGKWVLKNRHLVRGHWRQQPFGPKRRYKRPVFVPPYVKGPEGAPLKTKTEVHVWKR